MRKQYLLIVFILTSFFGFGQQYNYLAVDDTYTPEELVGDVLVRSKCDLVSNVRYQNGDGSPATLDYYTLGYFEKNGSIFPFEDGIVLSTTETPFVEGPYYGYGGPTGGRGINNYRWGGDQDLNDAIADGGGAPYTQFRSTMIEFDFVPLQSTVSFEYLFASNSYHRSCGEVCRNGAMFAAWLVDSTTGVGENLAKVPGTNLPISINTIRDVNKSNANCASTNEIYFGEYYDNGVTNPLASPIDFVGSTLPMQSLSANVVVGRVYKIKLAVMDFCPTISHNSAVFFKAGSFEIGDLDLGEDILVVNGQALCAGDSHTLVTGLDPVLFTFEWYKDNVLMVGETGPNLVVTETASYRVKAYIPNVTSCVMESDPIFIEFYELVELDQDPADLQLCPNAGVSTRFALDDAMAGTSSNSNYLYSYYLSQSDAQNDVNAIPSFYDLPNNVPSQTIWVRVYQLNNPCDYITSFNLSFINCVIELNRLSNLSICEGDPVQTFDLTVQTPLVYNNASGYSVDYYTTQNDANAAQNAIPTTNLANYNGFHGERIWVRVTNTSNPQVFGVTSFFLYRYLLPQVQTNYPALTACEIGSSGLGAFELNLAYKFIPVTPAGTSLEFYTTQQEALQGNPSLALPSQYTGAAGTLYVRVVNMDGGCFVVVPLQLQIVNTPVINPVGPITECDLNNDGFTEFNLDPYRNTIAGNPLPAHGVVSFHETQADADNNVNAIFNTGTYTNKVKDQQTIYARVGYANSSCYATVPITLVVNKTPPITPIGSMFICDINNDNVETVDLTSKESQLLTGLTATNYTITYHISANAAMSGTGAIGNPSNFSTSTSNIVYVRVTDINSGCFAVTEIELVLVDLPLVTTPLPVYRLCDTNGNGFESFDLGSLIPGIVGNQQGVDVSFHYSQLDAQEGVSPLSLQYQNVSPNIQTIYVRVFNSSTGCFVVTTLTLEVIANPVLTLPMEPYVICNANGNYGTINIFLYGKALVDATGQNFTFQFYETESDARNALNQITNPVAYNNLQPTNPVVWIRVVNPATGCWSVYPLAFQLVVPPRLPSSLPTIETCDDFGNKQDAITLFDLTQQDAALIAAQNVTGTYQIRYFTSQTSAASNTNWIGNPTQFQNTTNPQTIWVRIENTDLPGSCSRVMSFDILVRSPHLLHQPLPIILCDTQLPNDGKRNFDLRIRERDVLGGQPFQTVVTYHLSEQEANNGINAIADPNNFTNTVNPQTIYISAVNQYGCRSVITLTVRVLPLPEPNLNPTPLESCEIDGGAPGFAFFDLTLAEDDLSNFSDYTYSYFIDLIGAETNDPASRINNPEAHLSGTGSVFVRVSNSFTDTSTSCFSIVELPLIVRPLPNIGPMTTLAACMENPTLTTVFNLRDRDEQALAGANPEDFIVRYFGNEEDAADGVNPLPYIYTNIVDTRQLIWVRVEDKTTGCWRIASFLIQIEQSIDSNRPSNPEFCETDHENDGVSLVDLSSLDVEIIGNQPATNLMVNYYRTDGSLITPSDSGQVRHGEVIRAEVRSTNANFVCSSSVEFVIRLKDAPKVLPLKDGVVCYEYRDQWSIVSGHYLDTGVEGDGYTFHWTRSGMPIDEDAADILDEGKVLYAKRGGSYQVVVTGPNGCTTTRRALVDEAPSLTIDEVKITDSFGDTNAVEVIAYAGPNFSVIEYKMDNGSWQESNIFLDVLPGEHTVYVRIQGQPCIAIQVITIMDYPKYFTPNGDGYNDTWNIWSLKDQPMSKIYIFDRYGKLLKELSPAGEGWDGPLGGRPLPSTDYWFKAEYLDPKTGLQKEVTGHFSLKR